MKLQDPSLLTNEIYHFPFRGKYISYAPLTRFFAIRKTNNNIEPEWLNQASNEKNIPAFVLEK
jgi:hypothetical protein